MERLLGQVVQALPKLAEGEGSWGHGGDTRYGVGYSKEDQGGMNVGAVLKGEHGARIAVAVVKVAQKIEERVQRTVAATATPSSHPRSSTTPGSCQIK